MNNNSSCNLSYNVCIKPRGYGKTYKIMQELRKNNGKQTSTKKTS